MNIDVVLKLGGSAITVKDKLETLKEDELRHACSIVQSLIRLGKSVIVVHGAGSFGHHQAKQYGVNDGYESLSMEEKSTLELGFCFTRASVTKLNNLVIQQLCRDKVKAVGIQSFGFWKTDNGEVIQHNISIISDMVDKGFVPVLHGDCVFDRTKGTKILSGDVIIKVLCKELYPSEVLFLTDVDGIYNKDPKEKGAVLIPHIAVNRNGLTAINISTGMPEFDVTGGIDLKIQTAKDIVVTSEGRTRVHVCNVRCDTSKILSSELKQDGTIIALTRE